MDTQLKQRLIGGAVLVALAVIFLPMLVQGPAPDSGVANVSTRVPDAPADGFETRELPLAGMPADPPAGPAALPAPGPGAGGARRARRLRDRLFLAIASPDVSFRQDQD